MAAAASRFLYSFAKQLEGVAQTAERVKIEVENTGEKCPKCGQGEEIIRLGKFGKFWLAAGIRNAITRPIIRIKPGKSVLSAKET